MVSPLILLSTSSSWSLQAEAVARHEQSQDEVKNHKHPRQQPSASHETTIVVANTAHEASNRGDTSQQSFRKDLSSPREWLEYWEDHCGRQPGAYTVLRCDYRLDYDDDDDDERNKKAMCFLDNNSDYDSIPQNKTRWTIWGQDFHLQRLRNSYLCLVKESQEERIWEGNDRADQWTQQSQEIVTALLSHAETEMFRRRRVVESSPSTSSCHRTTIVTFMVTLLWQPFNSKAVTKGAWIRGHIFSSMVPVESSTNNSMASIRAVLALPYSGYSNHVWPGRTHFYPQAKLSSWCRQRRPLEDTFKVLPDVGEVLLVRDTNNQIDDATAPLENNNDNNVRQSDFMEILEGLTSNVFFVYSGGILRTAPTGQGILEGYARKLVLDHAPDCGLMVDTSHPVLLQDRDQWEEVFVTSSIRILVSVTELLVPVYGDNSEIEEKGGSRTMGGVTPNIAEFQSSWSQASSSSTSGQRLLGTILSRYAAKN